MKNINSNKKRKPNGYWTKENCKKEALKYTKRSDFNTKSNGAYESARKNGWLDIICSHMETKHKKAGYWTKERCLEVAKSVNTKKS